MPCTKLSTARALDCSRGIGGIQTLYIAHREDVTAITTDVDGTVSAFTMASGRKFFEFKMEKETALFTNPPIGNVANGSQYFDEILTIVFNQPDAATRNQIAILAKSNLIVIAKTSNNTFRLLGEENDGLVLNGGEGGSGTAAGDRNGYSLQLRGFASAPAKFVDDAVITSTLITFA